jgi:hypothetical protein
LKIRIFRRFLPHGGEDTGEWKLHNKEHNKLCSSPNEETCSNPGPIKTNAYAILVGRLEGKSLM